MTVMSAVREDWVTQLSPGEMLCDARTISALGVSAVGLWERPLCVGGTLIDPGYACVIIPVSWDGDLRMNGHRMAENEVYFPTSPNGFISRGANRYMYGLAVDSSALLATLATLRGVYPETLSLPAGPVTLSRGSKVLLVQRIYNALHAAQGETDDVRSLAGRERDYLFHVMLNAIFSATSASPRKRSPFRRATRIVMQAEERFTAEGYLNLSLADLCAAAGCSATTLYDAFGQVAGMPPLRYFRMRAINEAHGSLVQSKNQKGGVSDVATRHGFTELGRFSVEYKTLFGVSPSVTLAADIPS